MRLALVDYGMGNLRSVANAFEAIGEKVQIARKAADLQNASAIVVPGVGAFSDGIRNLSRSGLIKPLFEEVQEKKKPYLGICLGMQFLAEGVSEEGGLDSGFGWIKSGVKRIRPADVKFKIPHMGWNDLDIKKTGGLFEALPEDPVFYFVHSFQMVVAPEEYSVITSTCWHGTEIVASVQKENIYGLQFHPEKSQRVGLKLLENFASIARNYAEKTADSCPYPA